MIRDPRSIIIILFYLVANGGVLLLSLTITPESIQKDRLPRSMAPEYTLIEGLDYFHLRNSVPQMSLSADRMKSQGEEIAEFESPKGVYNYQQRKETLRYQGIKGTYQKKKEMLTLRGSVKITSKESQYFADVMKYYFQKDLITGVGAVKFKGEDLKTKDTILIEADSMRAGPKARTGLFKGGVKGSLTRQKRYEGQMNFSSHELHMDGNLSLINLIGDVNLKKDVYHITAGKADMYLENYNKTLKYFVMNDDVKMTEKLNSPKGTTERRAFAERLEGFGREQKMVLSGAPRVVQGSDVIKGYRITIRQNVDLIEVDDAMSDVQVKRKQLKEKQ